ncbi:fused MFS/spermidine synthase [bacterium]|nr:fused MFS/spermidine synthase [bacterium]
MQLSTALIYLFFFSSGFAALLYQVVWLKYLNLLFGSTTYATAAVVAAFMFGLSFGSRISTKFPRLYITSLKTYGLIEIGIGLFAISFPYMYSGFKIPFAWIFNLVGPQTFIYNLVTFALAFLVLLIPTSLMGATLPLLSHHLISEKNVTTGSGLLYAVNTTGAVFGILVSAFILIPNLGLQATVHVGVMLNVIVGLVCYLAGKTRGHGVVQVAPNSKEKNRLLWLYGISGLLAIGYEVLWTRLLVLHLGSSVYAYAIMLAVFLIGISSGSFVSGKWLASSARSPVSHFAIIQTAWAFSILLQMVQFANLPNTLLRLAQPFGGLTVTTQFTILFIAAVQLLFLPTFLSGALFPLVVTWMWKQGKTIQEAVGLSYSYNTIGGIFGSILAGFVLLPLFGTQLSLLVLAGGNLLLGFIAIFLYSGEIRIAGHHKWLATAALILFLAISITLQSRLNVIRSAGIFHSDTTPELLHVEEDPTATITVETRIHLGTRYRSLSVNGVNVAGTSPNLITIQKMQAHVPIILFGPSKKKEILHIGFGSGGTAYSASLYPNSKITVVEISPGVVRNADNYFESVNHRVARSGRLNVIYFDGRSYLQNTTKTYDVILSDSIHPRYSGNGSLYTKDYYELVYQQLNPGGVHSQWIPIYSVAQQNLQEILKAFSDVFEDSCVWYVNSTINPYIIVTGRKQARRISIADIQDAFGIPSVSQDLRSVTIFNELYFLDHFLFGMKGLKLYTGDAEPHIDDRLSVEYESSRIVNRQLSWWFNFRDLLKAREPVYAYLSSPDLLNHVNYERFYQATEANLVGQLYFVGGKPAEARKAFADAIQKNGIDREPVEYYQKQF